MACPKFCTNEIETNWYYLVQKILIHERREMGNRAKDLLYLHDTIEVFGSALPELKKV
jgi:hypothetical protein